MIFVDPIFEWTPVCGYTRWCHMGTDDRSPAGLRELHVMAAKIGLKRSWYQDKSHHKHYDLTPSKRALAIKAGAVAVSQREYAKRCSDNPVILRSIAEEEAEEGQSNELHASMG